MITRTNSETPSRNAAPAAESLLPSALERLTAGIGVFDADLNLVAWNSAFQALRGYPDELMTSGTPLADFLRVNAQGGDFGPGDPHELAGRRLTMAGSGRPEAAVINLPDGTALKFRCEPFPEGLLISYEDITEHQEATRVLRDNEERYTLLAEAVEEGLYDWYIERDEIYVAPRLQQHFGFDIDELGPKDWHWNARIHPDDLDHYLDTLGAHFSGEQQRWWCEYRFRSKQGDYLWILDHGYTVRDEAGKPFRLVGAIRDIHQRKRAEEALRASEARYELALRAINEGVYDWDIDAGTVLYSDRVYEVLGLSEEELSSPEDWLNRIHPDDLPGYKQALAEHFKNETPRFEHRYRYRDSFGNWRWALQHGIALRDETGRAYRMIGSTGDITELKDKESELAEKTEILETTLENIDQGITMVDKDLHTIALNSKFLDLLGFPPERFKSGFHIGDAFRYNAERGEYGPGDVEQQVRERLELAARFEPHELERTRPDGTVIAVRGKPLPGGGFVSTYTDVTEQRRTEAALRENEQRYALASRAATEGIYDWNLESGSLHLSQRAKEFLAFPSEPLTPAAWNDRIHPDDFEGYRQALIDHLKARTASLEHEYRIRDAGDGYRWILDRGIGIRDENCRVTRLVGAVSDITTRKLAEIELRRARDEAQAATQAKSNFLANMSHELRTPLNAIIGFTRIVMRRSGERLEAKQYHNLEKILMSAEHLLTLINSVLDLSKIEAKRIEVSAGEVDLEALLTHCLQTVEPLVNHINVALKLDVESGLPTIFSDEEKLRQIVLNLLGNAVKFTERGSIRVGVRRHGERRVAVEIADTGIGIPAEQLAGIFEEFGQVDSSSTREHGGTGLGLSIGRHLARLLGGDITVESREGEGSVFTLTLPVRHSPAETQLPEPRQ